MSQIAIPDTVAENVLKLTKLDLATDERVKQLYLENEEIHPTDDLISKRETRSELLNPELETSPENAPSHRPDFLNHFGGVYNIILGYLYLKNKNRVEVGSDLDDTEGLNSFKKFSLYLPLIRVLYSTPRFRVAEHLYRVKASCIDELQAECAVSYATARATVLDLVKFNLVKMAVEVRHPKRFGNEVIVYKWENATEKDVRKAVARIPTALGLPTPKDTEKLKTTESQKLKEEKQRQLEHASTLFDEYTHTHPEPPEHKDFRNWVQYEKKLDFETAKDYADLMFLPPVGEKFGFDRVPSRESMRESEV